MAWSFSESELGQIHSIQGLSHSHMLIKITPWGLGHSWSRSDTQVSLEGHATSAENQPITPFLYGYMQYWLAPSSKYCLT